jgi:hypothetical protein
VLHDWEITDPQKLRMRVEAFFEMLKDDQAYLHSIQTVATNQRFVDILKRVANQESKEEELELLLQVLVWYTSDLSHLWSVQDIDSDSLWSELCDGLVAVSHSKTWELALKILINLFDNHINPTYLIENKIDIVLVSLWNDKGLSITSLSIVFQLLNIAANRCDEVKVRCSQHSAMILQTIREHKNNQTFVQNSLRLLHSLSVDARTHAQLGNAGGCELFLDILRDPHDNIEVVEIVIGAICNMARDNQNKFRLGHEGACELLITVLHKYHEHDQIRTYVVTAMMNLAVHHENKIRLGTVEGCNCLLNLLREYKGNAKVVENISAALCVLTVDVQNENRADNAINCGVFFEILRKYTSNAEVLSAACSAFTTMSVCAASERGCSLNPECGNMLLNALTKYTTNADVRIQTIETIRNMAASAENQIRLGNLGGCELLLEVLREHKSDEEVVYQVCRVLKNISYHDDNQVRLGNSGGCELSLTLLSSYKCNIKIVENATEVIFNLSHNFPNKMKLSDAGGHELLTELMSEYQDHVVLTHHAKLALSNIDYQRENQDFFLDTDHLTRNNNQITKISGMTFVLLANESCLIFHFLHDFFYACFFKMIRHCVIMVRSTDNYLYVSMICQNVLFLQTCFSLLLSGRINRVLTY